MAESLRSVWLNALTWEEVGECLREDRTWLVELVECRRTCDSPLGRGESG